MRSILSLSLLALALAAPASRADEVVATFGRWRLERAALPDGSGAFFLFRAQEKNGQPSRLGVGCGTGKVTPYFSHARMAEITGDAKVQVLIRVDGHEALDTTMDPLGPMALLGRPGQGEHVIALIRLARETVGLEVRGRRFEFPIAGFETGLAELQTRCTVRAAAG